MNKIKLLALLVGGLILINLGLMAFIFFRPAPPPPPGPRREGRVPPGDRPKMMVIRRLHLDAQQVTAYEQLIDTHRDEIKKQEAVIRETKNKLYSTQLADTTGTDALMQQLSAAHQAIEWAHYRHFAALRKICRPDQLGDFNRVIRELAMFFRPKKQN